jgi:inosose dehydratase
MDRRDFLGSVGLFSIACFSDSGFLFAKDFPPHPKVKWGVAIIPWKDNFMASFPEVSGLGIGGVQIRGNVFERFKLKPEEFKELLKQYQLKAPILSGGDVPFDGGSDAGILSRFEEMADFLKAYGGKYLQVTTQKRDSYPPGKDKLLKLADSLNLIGESVRKKGVKLLLHNHMHQFCQSPAEVEILLNSTQPENVGFLLDIAHYAQAGGLPEDAIIIYKKRLELVHVKDLLSPKPGVSGNPHFNYQFVELGKGNKINLPAVFAALKTIKFKGWCMIELDSVPNPSNSPLQATQVSLDYLTSNFGYSFKR